MFSFFYLQATILTSKGKSIRRLGLEIASRPYVFSDTPDLELEIFLNYTNATRYTVSILLFTLQCIKWDIDLSCLFRLR